MFIVGVRTYVRTYVRTHVRTYVRTHIRTYVRNHTRAYVRTYERTYVHLYSVRVCKRPCACVRTHVLTYKHDVPVVRSDRTAWPDAWYKLTNSTLLRQMHRAHTRSQADRSAGNLRTTLGTAPRDACACQ